MKEYDLKTQDFEYTLPRHLVAERPPEKRGGSRLLVLPRNDASTVVHDTFKNLKCYLRRGDVLIFNNSKVIRARLLGRRAKSGGAIELLLVERLKKPEQNVDRWAVFARPAKKLGPGDSIEFAGGLRATIASEQPEGVRHVDFHTDNVLTHLDEYGEMPLPPYILQRRKELAREIEDLPPEPEDFDDESRYQTVYAKEPGSIAAPTAGLHFTEAQLEDLAISGIELAYVTLHVGAGTFKPVEAEDPSEHPMHEEAYTVPNRAMEQINKARSDGRRLIAVGTTSARVMESAAEITEQGWRIKAGTARTRLMILPGYKFKLVEGLLTNFHLPRSSLLMLVSALAGHQRIMNAYQEAIEKEYRFYSYGDAMLYL